MKNVKNAFIVCMSLLAMVALAIQPVLASEWDSQAGNDNVDPDAAIADPWEVLRSEEGEITLKSGHRYKVIAQPMSWNDALAYCYDNGGHLATITSKEEQDIVYSLVKESGVACWLGAYDDYGFQWVTGEPFEYANWAEGEPSGHTPGWEIFADTEEYVGIYATKKDSSYAQAGKWNDFTASSETVKGFVCEWDPVCLSDDGVSFNHGTIYEIIDVQPTCSKGGGQSGVCYDCHTTVWTEDLPPAGHDYGKWTTIAGNVVIPPIVKERTCLICEYVDTYKDWSYIWVSILILLLVVGSVFGVVNYIKAFKNK